MRYICSAILLLCVARPVRAQDQVTFQSDPHSAELLAVAKPLQIDESRYGCGPLREPGTTYYVSVKGDDKADGLSWDSAWRHVGFGIGKLTAGDTLIIGEGEYFEPKIEMGVKAEQSGAPGKPIRIMAAPRHRVVITGADRPGPLRKTADTRYTYEAPYERPKMRTPGQGVWESDTLILLQEAGSVESVDELPATYCYDAEKQRLYVRFSDSRGPEAHGVAVRPGKPSTSTFRMRDPRGLDIRGSHIHFKGLWFRGYHTAMYIGGNIVPDKDGSVDTEPRTYRGGHHITVEDCAFYGTDFAGLVLYCGAQWCLIKGNYGALNGDRGSLLFNYRDAQDNLFIDNWLDPSPQTIRTRGKGFHYGINNYGNVGPRNHVINNVMNDTRSFRSKFLFKETVIQGNVMVGEFYTYPFTYKKTEYTPEERVIIRNNTMLGRAVTAYQPMGPGGVAGNWAGPFKVFVNNFAVDQKNKTKEIEAARFADPAYVDYRLQSDSPLIGKAIGGGAIGAYRQPTGRILYVGPSGDDGAEGTSVRLAFKTLQKASAELRGGDTLHVMPGDYTEALEVRASGTADQPIRIRAHGKKRVGLPRLTIAGSHVTAEGFTFDRAQGDAILIRGNSVTVENCLVRDGDGAAVRASAVSGLSVSHCTFVNNAYGLVIEQGSRDASVRDCILASNRKAAVSLSDDSRDGFLASNNCYFGGALDKDRIADEPNSIIDDPTFVDAAKHDYRLQWDSPAACRAAFACAAGAFERVPKPVEIAEVRVANVRPNSASVIWTTPEDDTVGFLRHRPEGNKEWYTVRDPEQGTIHGVGVTLKPGTTYECQVVVNGRRGGAAEGDVQTFTTTTEDPPAVTYHVSRQGDDSVDGRSAETAWRTIRKACFEVGAGDTVLIAPGEYHHPIAPLSSGTADRRITFKRHGDGDVIIDGREVLAPLVNLPYKSHITIDGLIFTGTPRPGHPGVMVLAYCRGVEILNCRVGHNKPEGGFGSNLIARSCRDLRFENNIVWGTRYHIHSYGSTGSIIRNNTFAFGQVYSIHFTGSYAGTKLINNVLYRPTSVSNPAVAIFSDTKTVDLESDYNLFYPLRREDQVVGKIAMVYGEHLKPLVPGNTLEEWQQSSGQDRHSVHADPLFMDVRKGDFRLKPGSPAIGAGQGGRNIGACGVAK